MPDGVRHPDGEADRAELADLGVSVADYELLLIVSLEPRGVVL